MMRLRLRFGLLALLLAAFMTPAAAQNGAPDSDGARDCDDGAARLGAALPRFGDKAVDPEFGAMGVRGYQFDIATHDTIASLARGLSRYDHPRYERRTAALLYEWTGDDLLIYVADRNGLQSCRLRKNARAAFDSVMTALLASLPAAEASARGPVRRDGTLGAVDAVVLRQAELRQAALGGDTRARSDEFDRLVASASATLLPLATARALAAYDNLLVAPDGRIHQFPFALLREPLGARGYVIDRMRISIAPTVADIGIGFGLHRGAERDPTQRDWSDEDAKRAAIAAFYARAVVVGAPTYADRDYVLPPLKGARDEAKTVARVFGVAPLLDDAATLAGVKARAAATGGVRYLHLASHGVADFTGVGDNKSFVALAHGDRFDRAAAAGFEFGPARFGDGAVVVLSACQTGLGAARAGGIIGLPRLLQRAGAQSVLMSMWSVDDAATADFMTAFATALQRTGRAAAAYQEAVQATRLRHPDPADWAAFQLFSTAQF